jgi:hypothetical protein
MAEGLEWQGRGGGHEDCTALAACRRHFDEYERGAVGLLQHLARQPGHSLRCNPLREQLHYFLVVAVGLPFGVEPDGGV